LERKNAAHVVLRREGIVKHFSPLDNKMDDASKVSAMGIGDNSASRRTPNGKLSPQTNLGGSGVVTVSQEGN